LPDGQRAVVADAATNDGAAEEVTAAARGGPSLIEMSQLMQAWPGFMESEPLFLRVHVVALGVPAETHA
jgi:hypothetical protein